MFDAIYPTVVHGRNDRNLLSICHVMPVLTVSVTFILDSNPAPSGWASPKFSMFRPDLNGWNPLMVAANQGKLVF